MKPAVLRLKKNQERRLLAGHLWVYSNEVDIHATPLKELEPGQPVELLSSSGRWLGLGYANPHSLICARLVSRRRGVTLDGGLIRERLRIALALREGIYPKPFYRLVFGETDGLPGLVVDRYGELLVLQITTAGMERLRDEIAGALEELLQPDTMLLRNDTRVRALEGLPVAVETLKGTVPDQVQIEENGVRFQLSPAGGQKTGWFYDQADNRARLRRYVPGTRMLDVCCYLGGWGVSAALWGASEALCLDTSGSALEGVAENARLNGCEARVDTLKGDAFELLKQLGERGECFDLIALDPPAFIKRRKDLDQGVEAYGRLNRLALQLLEPGGILATSSCSFHLQREQFLRTVQKAARRNGQSLQLLESGQQSADHPVYPAIAETAYLKTFFLRALPGF
jgi:23S rRNA (cytosine1962-C5)-methyltransferase